LTDKIKCFHILVKKQSEALAILERLKKGEITSEPVRTEFGYHIIKRAG
jgi:parvulin-like peptidyl-prolyl isomerase